MTLERTRLAYSEVADRYIDLLGRAEVNEPTDLAFILDAFADVSLPILDAGCGPGHMAAYLQEAGHVSMGVDAVPEFVAHAEHQHPGISYEVGDVRHLNHEDQSLGGILAWYSLIHMDADELSEAFMEFQRVLAPEGVLVMAMFHGKTRSTIDHKVTPATCWPREDLTELLKVAGFQPASWSVHSAARGQKAYITVSATPANNR